MSRWGSRCCIYREMTAHRISFHKMQHSLNQEESIATSARLLHTETVQQPQPFSGPHTFFGQFWHLTFAFHPSHAILVIGLLASMRMRRCMCMCRLYTPLAVIVGPVQTTSGRSDKDIRPHCASLISPRSSRNVYIEPEMLPALSERRMLGRPAIRRSLRQIQRRQ